MMNLLHRLFQGGHFLIAMLFMLAGFALIGTAAVQLWQGIQPLEAATLLERLNTVLESIAVLTVALAALELGQTILEEQVHRKAQMSAPTRVRRFLSRFMVVLVVALSIETLVLVFRLSQEEPEALPYAASVGAAAALLLIGWGLFIRLNRSAEELEPEAMQAAKREDRKIEKSAKGDERP
jgi:hypothetical protein